MVRVCYFGTYRAEYSRNRIMIEGLRRNGVDVVECQETLWHGIDDRVRVASGGWKKLSFGIRALKTYARLLHRYRQLGEYDILVVGYPGQLDVFLARLLTWLRRKPLVWDVFMSIYLIAWERGLGQKGCLNLWVLRALEYLAFRIPDMLIQDTAEYVDWLCHTYHLKAERFRLVPTGADERVFYPVAVESTDPTTFRILYYGTFIPNHGVAYIIEAARYLADEPNIQFELIGDGPEKVRASELAQQYQLTNVTFIEWLTQAELVHHIAAADVCLGAFGVTPQSLMTIQNKIYEGLAMGKPVISGDSPVARTTLKDGEHILLCCRESPQALAEAIRLLNSNVSLLHKLAKAGYDLYQSHYTVTRLGAQFKKHLYESIIRH